MTEVSKKQELVRLTVNLVPRAYAAMVQAAELTGNSRTDVLNRAVQFYAFAEHVMSQGGDILVRDSNGETQLVKLL